MTLQELYDAPEKWTKGYFIRHYRGKSSFCLVGALGMCYSGEKMYEVYEKLSKAAGDVDCLTKWNDAPERTFEDIQRVIKEANV